jgi:hypothetical protein
MPNPQFYVLKRRSTSEYCTGGGGWRWEWHFSPVLKRAKLYNSLAPIKAFLNEAESRNESKIDTRPLFDRSDYTVEIVELRATGEEVPI